ncbi:hypothetical protein DM01DRAFT_1273260, partial [Hesseltinella vesiculosa]
MPFQFIYEDGKGHVLNEHEHYSYEFKKIIVDECLEKPQIPTTVIAAKYGLKVPRTAQRWVEAFRKHGDEGLMRKQHGGRKPVLNESHKAYLTALFDDNPAATIDEAIDGLTKDFVGLEIKRSAV